MRVAAQTRIPIEDFFRQRLYENEEVCRQADALPHCDLMRALSKGVLNCGKKIIEQKGSL